MRIPLGMVHVAPLHALDVVKSLAPSEVVHLVELDDPVSFQRELPARLQPPGRGAGLPPNVWCGMRVDGAESMKRARDLRGVHARVLWIYFINGSWRMLGELFEPWRCLRCGRRGGYRPRKGRPACSSLCDAPIDPQIQWLMLDPAADPLAASEPGKLGVLVYPTELPDVHPAEYEAARRRQL